MLAKTLDILTPALFSAFVTANLIASTVSLILITIPLFMPLEGDLPIPRILSFSLLFFLPTMATIFVVPMSIAVIKSVFICK